MVSLNSGMRGTVRSTVVRRVGDAKRRILAALVVLVMSAFVVTPVFAQQSDPQVDRLGTAAMVAPKQTLRMKVIEEKLPSGEMRYTPASSGPQASPLYPIWHYTCYFEGIKVPCSFFAWLWY